MKNLCCAFLAAFLLLPFAGGGRAWSQAGAPATVPQPDLPNFFLDALAFASESTGVSRLDIYLQMPYHMLSFTKNGETFSSNYEITLEVFDNDGTLKEEKLWEEHAETREYTESISRQTGKVSQKSFLVAPGKYSVAAQVRDNETKKVARVRRNVEVRDFASPAVSVSDIMLVNEMSTEGERTVIVPNVSGTVGEIREGFSIFFEAYTHTPAADTEDFVLDVRNAKGDLIERDTLVRRLEKAKNSCFMTVRSAGLPAGDYSLEVNAAPHNAASPAGESVPPSKRMVTVRWRGMPVSITNLDAAIDQLMYLLSQDEIDKMRNAAGDEKRRLFDEFWRQRDPSPNTEFNELMDEYYRRVEYANKTYAHYFEGWKTDRGMVFIIFGEPGNIERRPFEVDSKPYEIWSYYDINREFVFIDATGFGDYRLQNPIWDVRRARVR